LKHIIIIALLRIIGIFRVTIQDSPVTLFFLDSASSDEDVRNIAACIIKRDEFSNPEEENKRLCC